MSTNKRTMFISIAVNSTNVTARKMYVEDAREFAETLLRIDEADKKYYSRHCGGMLRDIGNHILGNVEKEEEQMKFEEEYRTYLKLKKKFEGLKEESH